MTAHIPITINVTLEQQKQIEEQARLRGYNAPADYLLALVEADAAVEEDDEVDIRAELKEGLRQALRGETVPLESLYDRTYSF